MAGKVGEAKNKLAEEIAQSVMSTLHYGKESVSVAFEEVDANDWASKVYRADIAGHEDRLYKKPGYTMQVWPQSVNKKSLKEKNMEIKKIGTQPSGKGPAEWFTGTVRIDPLFTAPDPALVGGASVTFEPGARTTWHTHPLGQTLIVTAGCGWAQKEGGPVEEIHPGDIVLFSPNERHWHGATPTTAVTHIAIQEKKDGEYVKWMEHVTDEQYLS